MDSSPKNGLVSDQLKVTGVEKNMHFQRSCPIMWTVPTKVRYSHALQCQLYNSCQKCFKLIQPKKTTVVYMSRVCFVVLLESWKLSMNFDAR